MASVQGYFDTSPKQTKSDYYNYNGNLENFLRLLSEVRLILVIGIRRLGKSSLVQVGLNEAGVPYLLIDARAGPSSLGDFLRAVEQSFAHFSRRNPTLAAEVVQRLNGGPRMAEGHEPAQIHFTARTDLINFLDSLNQTSQDRKQRIVVAIDEAQRLRDLDELDLDEFLSYVFENFRSLEIVLTGSEIGLLNDIMQKPDLASLAVSRISIAPLTREQAKEFLTMGFDQRDLGEKLNDPFVTRAFDVLGGNVGWLTNLRAKLSERKI